MDIISRQEAKERGLKRFYTGVACKNGHDSERYVKSGGCIECSRLIDLFRRHDGEEARNKSIIVEQNRRLNAQARRVAKNSGQKYYLTGIPCKEGHICDRNTKTGCCVECSKILRREWARHNRAKAYVSSSNWRKNHLKRVAERQAKIRKANPEKEREYQSAANQNRREKYATDPTLKEKIYQWRKDNPHKWASIQKRHYANRMGAEGSHSTEDWLWLCAKFDDRCLKCGKKKKLTEDHIVAPDIGGSDYIENIQPLCASCNSSKGQKVISYYPVGTFLLYPSKQQAI